MGTERVTDAGSAWRRHHRLWISAGSITGIAVLAAVIWFWFLPDYRPGLKGGERYGVDVSNHQGEIDWPAVAGDNVGFVYLKASEGGDFSDARFTDNWSGAGQVGLDRGAYHFFTLCTPGQEQAEHFLSVLPDQMELAPALDLELAGNCRRRPGSAAVRAEVDRFLDVVESETGTEVVLYVGDDWEDGYPMRAAGERPLWHRRFLRRPDVDGWLIWQITGFANVEGIDGDADLNIMRPPPRGG